MKIPFMIANEAVRFRTTCASGVGLGYEERGEVSKISNKYQIEQSAEFEYCKNTE